MEIPWYDDKWCILAQYFFERKCFYRFLDIRYNLINSHLSPGAAQYMGIWPKMGLIWPIRVGPTYVPLIITKVKGIIKVKNLSKNRLFSFGLIVVQSTWNLVLIGDHSVCQNYNYSDFSTKPSFYRFYQNNFLVIKKVILLCIPTFFIFCLFSKDMWEYTCQISCPCDVSVLRFKFLNML